MPKVLKFSTISQYNCIECAQRDDPFSNEVFFLDSIALSFGSGHKAILHYSLTYYLAADSKIFFYFFFEHFIQDANLSVVSIETDLKLK